MRNSKTYRVAVWAFKDTFWAYRGDVGAVSPGQMLILPFCLFLAALIEILVGPNGAPGGKGAVEFWIMMVVPLGILLDIILTVILKSLGEWSKFDVPKLSSLPAAGSISTEN